MIKDINIITGSSGFIGRHLVDRLERRVSQIPHAIIPEVRINRPNIIYYLAAYGNMAHHKSAEKILQANVIDLGHFVSNLMMSGNAPDLFLYVSSSSVMLPVQTIYSRTKRAAEELLQGSQFPVCIVRPFSVTGVGEQPEHLIPTLIRSCMEGTPVDLVPDSVHDFVDVEDLVDGMILLAKAKAIGIFELGSGIGWTNREVLEMVEDICGKKANVSFIGDPIRAYDNENWYCRNFDAAKHGWVSTKTLAHSITEMVEDYKNGTKI
jgi:nucleoside-diphosphate-sugar epimerase